MTKGRPWYKRYPSDFLHGTAMLSCEEKGAYSVALDLMYERGGAIPADAVWIARMCGCSVRKWTQTLLPALIAAGKLQVIEGGKLTNGRMEFETQHSHERSDIARESGRRGGIQKAAKAIVKPIISDLSPIYLADKPEIIELSINDIKGPPLANSETQILREEKEESSLRSDTSSAGKAGHDEGRAARVREAVAVWNNICGPKLSCVRKVTASRQANLCRRLKADFDDDQTAWAGYCRRVAASPFLTNANGTNRGSWRADFDFVLEERNLVRIMEGTWDPTGLVNRGDIVDHKTRMQQISRASLFDDPAKAEHDGVTINLNPGEWNDD